MRGAVSTASAGGCPANASAFDSRLRNGRGGAHLLHRGHVLRGAHALILPARQTKPVSATIAAEIVAQLADGVAYAHSQGVLHRDIKPTNVLLEHTKGVILTPEFTANMVAASECLDFTPKLTDFGLAKIEEFGCGETRPEPSWVRRPICAGASRGAIERDRSAADVYALGTLLYEILTRRSPFVGASDAGICTRSLPSSRRRCTRFGAMFRPT